MLEAAAEDGLPSKLCQACKDHMRVAYDFRSQATYSERYFRNIIFLPAMQKPMGSEPDLSREADYSDESLDEAGDKNEMYMETSFMDDCGGHENIELVAQMKCEADIKSDDDAATLNLRCPLPKNTLSANSADLKPDKEFLDEETFKLDLSDKGEERQTTKLRKEEDLPVHKKAGNLLLLNDIPTNGNYGTRSESKNRQSAKQKRKKVECNLCGIGFTHINSLKQHLNKHSGARPFQCEYCEKSFARRTVLNIHRRLHTGERPYQCDECIRTFITKDAMHRHKLREHTEEIEVTNTKVAKYNCSICNEGRCSKNSLAVHMRKMHGKKVEMPRKTEKADTKTVDPRLGPNQAVSKEFSRQNENTGLARKLQTPEVLYKCKACSRSFEKKYQLLEHLQSHANGEFLIKRHLRLFTPKTQKSHYCNELPTQKRRKATSKLCDATRLNAESSKSRCRQTTGSVTQWACPICRQEFSAPNVFQEHLRKHIAVPAFACSDLKFGNSSFLKCQPSPLNVDTKPAVQPQRYQCAACNTCFAMKFKLRYHLELHKIQNAHCRKCEEKFASHEELLKHIKRQHFDKRNHDFQCPDCSESLYDMRDLKEHLNERHCANIADLEACDMCEVSFKSTREYYSHVYDKHDAVNKYCDECGAYFDSRKAFDKHILSHFV